MARAGQWLTLGWLAVKGPTGLVAKLCRRFGGSISRVRRTSPRDHLSRAFQFVAALNLLMLVGCATSSDLSLRLTQPGPAVVQAKEVEPNFQLSQKMVEDRAIFRREMYNYAPAIIHDGALYHLYWCGGFKGDFILHAQSDELDGPWHASSDQTPFSFDVALQPTQSPTDFDGKHTCDPNVIKVKSVYYLYYGGEAYDGALAAIGVAKSIDGVHFERLNQGKPAISAAQTNPNFRTDKLTYGAGQPAVLFAAPYFYLAFTDSTGVGANPVNGAGQFALRSRDPSFSTKTEELTATGWRRRTAGFHTAEYAFSESFGIDWAYDTQTKSLFAVTDRIRGKSTILELEPHSLRTLASGQLSLNWREGPAIVAEANKKLPLRPDCRAVDIAIFAAQGNSDDPWTWNAIAYSRGPFHIGHPCR